MTASNHTGGVKTVEVPSSRDGQRLDNFLMARLPGVPKSLIYRVIRKGQVRVNGKRAKPMQKLEGGDMVRIPPVRTGERGTASVPPAVLEKAPGWIIHEDPDLLVCNKPAGIAVHGGSGIKWGLIDIFRQLRPGEELDLVHRLDRETSGVLVLARNHGMVKHLQDQFARRETSKRYFTLLDGLLPGERTTVTEPLARREMSGERIVVVDEDGKPAETHFLQLERYGERSLVEASPVTGRTHQIRVHAAHLGAPCAGDSKYSSRQSQEFWKKRGLKRLFLHAHSLEFEMANGEPMLFSCPLPDDLRAITEAL